MLLQSHRGSLLWREVAEVVLGVSGHHDHGCSFVGNDFCRSQLRAKAPYSGRHSYTSLLIHEAARLAHDHHRQRLDSGFPNGALGCDVVVVLGWTRAAALRPHVGG